MRSYLRSRVSPRGTAGAFVLPMTRFPAVLGFVVFASSPAFAQPKGAPPPQPKQPDDMAGFEKDLDALFAKGGLTADQAASRAAGASPTVRRRAAEVEAAIAQANTAELARIPIVSGKA